MRKYLYGGYEELIEEKNKEIDRLNNKVSELENINEKIGLALDSAENKVDRLNNIINELEKIFIECDYQHLQRKLKELKEE